MADRAQSTGPSRRTYLRRAASLGVVGTLPGCLDSVPNGTLHVRIPDDSAAIDGLSSCELTIVGLWLLPTETVPSSPGMNGTGPVNQTAGDVSGTQARRSFRFGDPRRIDLLEGGGMVTGEEGIRLDAIAYEFVQFQISGVQATATDGGDAFVTAPGRVGTIDVIQFDHAFRIEAGEELEFVAGLRPVRDGDQFVLRPLADRTTVR